MVHLNFIATAKHNSAKIKRDARVLLTLIGVCLLLMVIARQFYGNHTDTYRYVKSGNYVELGWPASVFSYSMFFAGGFALFLMLSRFKQDLRNPALGITNQGLFVNQQMIRNAFVPWSNIEHAELRGHISSPVLRVFFKDRDALLKGQPFILKSIIKPSLTPKATIGITKDEAVGDLVQLFGLLQEKGVVVQDHMEHKTVQA